MLREPSRGRERERGRGWGGCEVKDEILMVFFQCMKTPSRLKFMFIWMQAVNHFFLLSSKPKTEIFISDFSRMFTLKVFFFTVEVQHDKKTVKKAEKHLVI